MSMSEMFKIGSTIGYGMSGRAEEDRAEARKKLQMETKLKEAQANNFNASTNKIDEEVKALKDQNALIQMQLKLQQNQMAAKDLDLATDALVTNGNYEEFNKVVKSNPTIKEKLQANYGVSSIRPIDWNNKEDIKELTKKGLSIEDISRMDDEAKAGISKAFYMADNGQLTSLDSFIQQTGYINRATSDKVEAYVGMKEQLANIGKRLSTDQVEAESADAWLEANPDKTWNDWVKQQQEGGKEETITNAGLKSEYADLRTKKTNGELSKDEEIRLDTLDKLFSTDNDEKRKILEKGLEITKKYKGNLFDAEIADEDIVNAKLYAQQAGIKPDTKANREFKDQFNTLKQGKRLTEEVNKLKDEEISRGLLDAGVQKLQTMLSDKAFKSKSPEEKAKVLKSIEMKTKLGKFLASYIKSISGTAVAEAEYKRLADLFGQDVLTNTQTLKTAVNTFVGELDEEFKNMAKTSLLDNPSTTLDLVKRYKELGGKDNKVVITGSEEDNKKTVEMSKNYLGKTIRYNGKLYKVDEEGNMTEVQE